LQFFADILLWEWYLLSHGIKPRGYEHPSLGRVAQTVRWRRPERPRAGRWRPTWRIRLTVSLTLYPAWTYWANVDDAGEGRQDFNATLQTIRNVLIERDYTEDIT
jgi:hypothetical protein